MSGAKNYGFSGLAVTLPKVWQEFDKELTEELIRHDKQAQYVAKTLIDLTEGLHILGSILRYDYDERRIHNRVSNNETYYSYQNTISFIRGKIEALMNYVLVIGEMALELLETMWAHSHRITREEPDEFAFRLARGTYNGVMENVDS